MKAPFPWFGGKSKVAPLIWDRFGDVRNYVEPFAGSLAVLLGRPSEPKIETVNDLDFWIANFWRALQADPEVVAKHADWPVNEADLHARHLWLVRQTEFREKMKTDPDYFDVKIAGWWVWGISQWIGSGWCAERPIPLKRVRIGKTAGVNGISYVSGISAGQGVHRSVNQKRPQLGGHGGFHGVHASALGGLYEWMFQLSCRLRRVRVCCGDWKRILGPAATTCIGITGVLLDPPYAVEDRSDVYGEDSRDVACAVRQWAVANGDNPDLRIALCGYDTEHVMPASWTELAWKANGGFANQKSERTRGQENSNRERIWFSPHCLQPHQGFLFG